MPLLIAAAWLLGSPALLGQQVQAARGHDAYHPTLAPSLQSHADYVAQRNAFFGTQA